MFATVISKYGSQCSKRLPTTVYFSTAPMITQNEFAQQYIQCSLPVERFCKTLNTSGFSGLKRKQTVHKCVVTMLMVGGIL